MTKRALLARINRTLKEKNQAVKAGRGRALEEMGAFYLVDNKRGRIVEKDVNLEELGRRLDVMKSWEELAD